MARTPALIGTLLFGTFHLGDARGVSAGSSHVCSIRKETGTAVCWGWDSGGQVSTAPKDEKFLHIAAGVRHNCGIRQADNKISCWGSSFYNETEPPRNDEFKAIEGGYWHTCGMKNDDTVTCWGSDSHGQAKVPAAIGTLAV